MGDIKENKRIVHETDQVRAERVLASFSSDSESMLSDVKTSIYGLIASFSTELSLTNKLLSSKNSNNQNENTMQNTMLAAAKTWNPYKSVNTLNGIRSSKITELCAILYDLDGLEHAAKHREITHVRLRERLWDLLKETREALVEIAVGTPSYYYAVKGHDENDVGEVSGWIIHWSQESNILRLTAKNGAPNVEQGREQSREAFLPSDELDDLQSDLRTAVTNHIAKLNELEQRDNASNETTSETITLPKHTENRINTIAFDRWKTISEPPLYEAYASWIVTNGGTAQDTSGMKIVALVENAPVTWESDESNDNVIDYANDLDKVFGYIADIAELGWAATADTDRMMNLLLRIGRWE